VSEIEEFKILRDAPASKLLKVGPAPRQVLPPQGIFKKNLKKSSEISASVLPQKLEKKKEKKRDRSISPQPQSNPQPHPLSRYSRRFSGQWKKKEKRNRGEREKEALIVLYLCAIDFFCDSYLGNPLLYMFL